MAQLLLGECAFGELAPIRWEGLFLGGISPRFGVPGSAPEQTGDLSFGDAIAVWSPDLGGVRGKQLRVGPGRSGAWAKPVRVRSSRISSSNAADTASSPALARTEGLVRPGASARTRRRLRRATSPSRCRRRRSSREPPRGLGNTATEATPRRGRWRRSGSWVGVGTCVPHRAFG